ncbi:cytochrome c3 family protein [Deltaproteobacteria bacterium IMCC39524]|nr:cytochrome c3 family protein [Deltaproteobacteria bacterium IMCC39524]
MTNFLKPAMLLIFLLSLMGDFSRVWALEILYPRDGTYVTKSNYLIIQGGGEQLLDGMLIEIDGVRSDLIDLSPDAYRSLYADKLVVEPLFDPGENKITVEGYLQGKKVASSNASVYYLADETESPPTGYRREIFHLAEREDVCAACHNMQPSVNQLQNPTINNPCASCHARMLAKAHVHGPAGVYDCSYCHDAESRPAKYALRLDEGALCLECHEEQRSLPLLHGPVDASMCVICHDPHASDHPAQLTSELNQGCLECHASLIGKPHVASGMSSSRAHPLQGPENPREPQKKLNCSSCHNPHGGAYAKYFVGDVQSPMQLCAECHRK